MTTDFWKRIAQNRLLDVGAVGIALLVVVMLATKLPERAKQIDFVHYYLSSRLLLEHKNPYATPLAPLCEQYGFVCHGDIPTGTNPPPLLWLFAPFALLPPLGAYCLWQLLQVAALAVLLWQARRLLANRLSARGFRFLVAAAVASAPVYWHFYYAQVQLLLAALALTGYAWMLRGRTHAACLAVTAAGLLKLFPLVLVPWFIWGTDGDRRKRITRAAAVVALAGLVFLATGPELWGQFVRDGMKVVSDWTVNRQSNFSLPSFVMNFGFAAYGFAPPEPVARVWWRVGAATGLCLLGACYTLCLRTKRDMETQFCLLCVAMLVGGMVTWGNYFVFLIFPMTVLARRLAANPGAGGILGFALLCALLNSHGGRAGPFLDEHLHLKVLCNYLPLYGLLVLTFCFAGKLRGSRDG